MSTKELLKIGVVCMLLGVVALSAGCASGDTAPDAEDVDRGSEASPMPDNDVVLSAEDNGTVVELGAGQALVVTLDSNPSTGYRWEVSEVDEAVLAQIGEAEFKEASTEGEQVVGAGGTETFYFASAAGETTLTLVYHRTWEDVEPEQVFSVEVVVQ